MKSSLPAVCLLGLVCGVFAQAAEKYDCRTREMWSDEKKEWCCKNKQLGCTPAPPTAPVRCPVLMDETSCMADDHCKWDTLTTACVAVPVAPPAAEFNCMTREMWSDKKKEWCCKNKQLGCDSKKPLGEPTAGSDEYGCFPSAGQVWCEAKAKCLRPWEEECLGWRTEPKGELKKGDVCKSGGVETGKLMDRSKDCPRRTRCKPKRGQMAIGGEVQHTCQRVAKWKRSMSFVTRKGMAMKDAIAKAGSFAKALLKSLRDRSDDVLEVVIEHVCQIPAAQAARGIKEDDLKSTRCQAVGAGATRRNLRPLEDLEDLVAVYDAKILTDDDSEDADDMADVAKKAAKDIEGLDIDQVVETAKEVGEGYESDSSSKSKTLSIALVSLLGVCMASTFAVVMVKFVSKRKASVNFTESPAENVGTPVTGEPQGAFRELVTENDDQQVTSI